MTFQLTEPVLIIGLGGVGTKLAEKAKTPLNSDCLFISYDQNDLTEENSIKISTKSIINPSTQLIRGSALESSDDIKEQQQTPSSGQHGSRPSSTMQGARGRSCKAHICRCN